MLDQTFRCHRIHFLPSPFVVSGFLAIWPCDHRSISRASAIRPTRSYGYGRAPFPSTRHLRLAFPSLRETSTTACDATSGRRARQTCKVVNRQQRGHRPPLARALDADLRDRQPPLDQPGIGHGCLPPQGDFMPTDPGPGKRTGSASLGTPLLGNTGVSLASTVAAPPFAGGRDTRVSGMRCPRTSAVRARPNRPTRARPFRHMESPCRRELLPSFHRSPPGELRAGAQDVNRLAESSASARACSRCRAPRSATTVRSAGHRAPAQIQSRGSSARTRSPNTPKYERWVVKNLCRLPFCGKSRLRAQFLIAFESPRYFGIIPERLLQ